MRLQSADLVVFDALGPVRCHRVHSLETDVPLGPGNEKGLLKVDFVQARKVDVCFVHDIEASDLVCEDIQQVDIVEAHLGDVDETRHGRSYIIKCIELYPSLGLSELRPPEHAQAKVYRGRVKGVYVALQIDLEIVAATTFPRLTYQYVGELL